MRASRADIALHRFRLEERHPPTVFDLGDVTDRQTAGGPQRAEGVAADDSPREPGTELGVSLQPDAACPPARPGPVDLDDDGSVRFEQGRATAEQPDRVAADADVPV